MRCDGGHVGKVRFLEVSHYTSASKERCMLHLVSRIVHGTVCVSSEAPIKKIAEQAASAMATKKLNQETVAVSEELFIMR